MAGAVLALVAPAARLHGQIVPRELTPSEQARHVLDRLAFGARPGDLARVDAIGVDRWIARQLAPERIDDRALESALERAFPSYTMKAGELLRAYPPPASLLVARRLRGETRATREDSLEARRLARRSRAVVGDLAAARLMRAVESERQLAEVLSDFWLNHFSVYSGKGPLRYFLGDFERDAIRPHVLGRFRDLLGAVAHSPAMLLYLDNAQSVADSTRPTLAGRRRVRGPRRQGINENYARELLELHTLGVDGGYTQQDILEVARALTGWTVRPPRRGDGTFAFDASAHDAGAKVVLGKRLPAGRGIEDGEDVLDLLARHPSTARHIARKLAVRLVSDAPPEALVARAADTFTRTDGDLRAVVRTIVTAPEFFSRTAYRSKVKSPFEVVASAARALGAASDRSPVSARIVARLGQPIYGRQSPDGWPEEGGTWMNTGAILARINFGLATARGELPGADPRAWPAYARLVHAPRTAQVDGVVAALLGGTVSAETRQILLRGEHPMLAGAPDGDTAATTRPLAGLDQLIGLALGSPEFQRR